MIQLFKHKYFKYTLLVFLALKGSFFVLENVELVNKKNIEICYEFDADDFENETEDQKEFDESEKINQSFQAAYHFQQNKAINNCIAIFKIYRIQYLEFTTPPPEFA